MNASNKTDEYIHFGTEKVSVCFGKIVCTSVHFCPVFTMISRDR